MLHNLVRDAVYSFGVSDPSMCTGNHNLKQDVCSKLSLFFFFLDLQLLVNQPHLSMGI